MREIKFRAWFPKEFYSEPHMAYQKDRNSDNTRIWHLAEVTYPDPDGAPIYMQYTGLKDKNGKEIYESDKISYTGFDGKRHVGIADWLDSECRFVVRFSKIISYFTLSAKTPQGSDTDLVVVGNTYENPELPAPPTPDRRR